MSGKKLVIITVSEGGAEREDLSGTDIESLKSEVAKDLYGHHKDCACSACSHIRLYDSMEVGDEGEKGNSWIFMIKE